VPISDYLKGLREKVGHDLLLGPAVAAVIRNNAGEVLIHQRSDNGLWEIPAGGIDPDEAPAQAVVREVYEETGLKVRPLSILGVFGGITLTYPNGDKVQPTTTLFECKVIGGRLESRDGEAVAFRYVLPQDVPKKFFCPPDVFEAGRTGAYFVWDESWLGELD
jgi:mutator protein MutT